MTIPSNVSFSKNGSRLTTRCTAENGDKIVLPESALDTVSDGI